jgi:hypothetical protein
VPPSVLAEREDANVRVSSVASAGIKLQLLFFTLPSGQVFCND